jgi:hypothetical protein
VPAVITKAQSQVPILFVETCFMIVGLLRVGYLSYGNSMLQRIVGFCPSWM